MDFKPVFERLGIVQLNEMQQTVLDQTNQNLLLLSPTGSGKTLSFVLPLLKRLDKNVAGVQAVIISPTRELAMQIEKVFKQATNEYKILCCYGGHSTRIEANSFSEAPAVLVGTPGRLAYHIDEGSFEPLDVTQLVLDEFDKSLELGFLDEIGFIVRQFKSLRYRFLASATPLKKWPSFLSLDSFKTLDFLSQEELLPKYQLFRLVLNSDEQRPQILSLLAEKAKEKSVVFVNTREVADDLQREMHAYGLSVQLYHGGLEQQDREKALVRFRNGSAQILLTTDLGARGLDIADVKNIVHFELPREEASFLHRNGRTARMQAGGEVYVFDLQDVQNPNYIDKNWPVAKVHSGTPVDAVAMWETLYFSLGKKDKINKVDVLGFLTKTAGLPAAEVGMIEVKDHAIYVAVAVSKALNVAKQLNGQKIKGKKVKIAVAN